MTEKLNAIIKIDTENSNKIFGNLFILVNLFFLTLSSYTFFTGNELYISHIQYHLLALILIIFPLKVLSVKLEYQNTFKYIFLITYIFYIVSTVVVNNQIDTSILFILFTINLYGIIYLSKKIYAVSSVLSTLILVAFSYFPMLYRPERDLVPVILYRTILFVIVSIVGYAALSRILRLMGDMAEATFNPFIDKVTGVYNKYYLKEVIKNITKSEDKQLSIIVADVDNMKQIISKHGYNAAEAVLQKLADIMRGSTRQNDSVCRVEEDQFVIIVQHPKEFQVEQLAERIKASIQNENFTSASNGQSFEGTVTCSFGVVTLKEGEDSDKLLTRANDTLREAKKNGRNTIEKGQ